MSANRLQLSLRALLIFAVFSGARQGSAEEGEVMVQTHCAACHSLALVYSQNGDHRYWRNTIDLMREKHKLGHIGPEQESAIIDYLANRAVASAISRRAPLEDTFLP